MTLVVDYLYLRSEVGRLLHNSRTPSGSALADVNKAIERGLRRFYYPPALPGEKSPHRWSFLQPILDFTVFPATTGTASSISTTTITTTADTFYPAMVGRVVTFTSTSNEFTVVTYTDAKNIIVDVDASAESGAFTIAADAYRLPDAYGGHASGITFSGDETYGVDIIEWVSETAVRELLQYTNTGRPRKAAEIVVPPFDGTVDPNWDMKLWPTPDQVYTLQFQYEVKPVMLSGDTDQPLGGPAHGETVLAACLAAADRYWSPENMTRYEGEFIDRLRTSVGYDRQAHAATSIGNMGDPAWTGSSQNQNYRTSALRLNGVLLEDL